MIDSVTALGKVNILSITALNTAAVSSLPKPLNTAGFYLITDSLVNNLDTYIEDSNSIIAKPLDIL